MGSPGQSFLPMCAGKVSTIDMLSSVRKIIS
jgi:hypothetical protein